MGCMRFKALNFVEGSIFNNFQFDSNAQRSLSKALGTDPNNFELKVIKDDGMNREYEVWAGGHPDSDGTVRPKTLRGHLYYETPAARHARLD